MALAQKFTDTGTVHNRPARLFGTRDRIKLSVFSRSCQNRIVIRLHDQIDVLCLQFIVELLLLRMIDNIPLRIHDKCISLGSHCTLITQSADRTVIQIDKEDSLFLTASLTVTDSATQRDHPRTFPADDMLHMRGCELRSFRTVQCLCIPFLRIQIQITVY